MASLMSYLKLIYADERKIVVLIFLFAFVIRFIAVLSFSAGYQVLSADAADYDRFAINLLSGKGFIDPVTELPTSSRTPLYPLFLAVIYYFFGHSYFAVRIVQCILGSLLCIIIFYTGKALFEKKVGLLSAAILCAYPPYIFYSFFGGPVFLLSENLFTFLLGIFTLFVIKILFIKTNFINSFISGLLTGLLVLTRPVFALFPFFLAVLIFYKEKSIFFTVRQTLVILAGFLVIIAPWAGRNYIVHKAFVPFSTEGGFVLYAGNNPEANGAGLTDTDFLFSKEELNRLNSIPEAEKDSMFRAKVKEFLISNYKKLPILSLKKLLVFWDPYTTDYTSKNAYSRRFNPWFFFIIIFALPAIIASLKSGLNINNLLLPFMFIYFIIMTIIFFGEPRFRYPLEPYLIILASYGIFRLYGSLNNKLLSTSVVALVIIFNLFLYYSSDIVLNSIRSLLNRR